MRKLTNTDGDTVIAPDEKVYTQERNVLRFACAGQGEAAEYVAFYTNLAGTFANPIASYALDANGEAIIDVSDYMRTYPSVTSLSLECNEHARINISVAVAGLINPKRLLLPPTPYNAAHKVIDVVAPTFMYKAALVGIASLVEFRGSFDDNDAINNNKTTTGARSITDGSNIIPSAWGVCYVTFEQDIKAVIKLRAIPCDVVPACVEWVGATGARKRATWLVGKYSFKKSGAVSLLPAVGDYNQHTGREDSATLYLDGLTRYDMAYYGDIVTSSDVRVLIGDDIKVENIGTDGKILEDYRVQVTTDSLTMQDGDAGDLNKLEINVNLHSYAVNL